MKAGRKILLADPIMYSHSLLYYKAALASEGFEDAEFTVATMVADDSDRQRLLKLAVAEPRLNVRILGTVNGQCTNRLKSWRGFGRAMRKIERILRAESFDLIVYLYLDYALGFFALPWARSSFRAHFANGIAGLIFRDNGLRIPSRATCKAKLRSSTDRYVLRRALAAGPFRKIAFLDHWCADRARQLWNCTTCGYGVDPVFHRPHDGAKARSSLGLNPDDFVVLFFGTMSDRKGVAECLALLRQAPLPEHRTVIVVAGPVEPSYRERLKSELAGASKRFRVIHQDRFIPDAEQPPFFAAADCVVCVYKDFTGSSNVLLHAAIFGKPALVSPGGAMADAVRKYEFGEVVSLNDPGGFVEAAAKLAKLGPQEKQALGERALTYGRTMDARRFMSQFY